MNAAPVVVLMADVCQLVLQTNRCIMHNTVWCQLHMLMNCWHTCCRCGAYARALQCYETYVRQVHGGGLNPAAVPASGAVAYQYGEVSFLLEVYSGLEEPDGLTGEGCWGGGVRT